MLSAISMLFGIGANICLTTFICIAAKEVSKQSKSNK